MKSSIQFKIFILSILIIIPVGILYFNLGEDLFINIKENLENRQILYSGGFNPDIDDKIKLKHYLDGILVASSLHQDKTIIKNFSQRLEE